MTTNPVRPALFRPQLGENIPEKASAPFPVPLEVPIPAIVSPWKYLDAAALDRPGATVQT